MKLSQDNEYPVLLYSPKGAPPNTHLVFTLEDKEEWERKGWTNNWQPSEYPKHIQTGKTRKVASEWVKDEFLETPESIIVHSAEEERQVLASLEKSNVDSEKVEAPRRGRPPMNKEEVAQVA